MWNLAFNLTEVVSMANSVKVALFLCVLVPVFAAERTTISGKVLDAAGTPLKDATVLIYKAGVKTGYSTYCPTCYVDCGKHTVTGSDGGFKLDGLSPDLLFTLLVLHDGETTATVDKVDPAKGPLEAVSLKPRATSDDPAKVLRGRVVNLQGNPLRNAVVEQQGVIFANGGQAYGDQGWTDSIGVSNEKGEFEIAYQRPAAKIIASVAARGMAPKLFTAPTGPDRKTMTVAEGATVRGRLVYKGKPVWNAEVGLMSHNRRSGTTYPEVRIGTQEDGSFAITNVPAGRIWTVYPKMESLGGRGLAGSPIDLETKDNGEIVNVADIELAPAYKLSGRVVLADGKPVIEGMRLVVSSTRAWDTQTIMLPLNGYFEFLGLGPGVYSLSPAVKGYELEDGFEQEVLMNQDREMVIQIRPRSR